MIYHLVWSSIVGNNKVAVPPYVKDYATMADRDYPTNYYKDAYGPYKLIVDYIGYSYNPQELLAEAIKESEDDSFIFILQNKQLKSFKEWLVKFELEDYVVYNMPQPITNDVHKDNGRNLTMYVLASSKHVWREMYE